MDSRCAWQSGDAIHRGRESHKGRRRVRPARCGTHAGCGRPCYDIAGNLLFQHSMDAGERWMLSDAAGKPMLAWDFNERQQDDGSLDLERRLYQTEYDELHRPLRQWVGIDDNPAQLIESFSYGEPPLEAADEERQARSSATSSGKCIATSIRPG